MANDNIYHATIIYDKFSRSNLLIVTLVSCCFITVTQLRGRPGLRTGASCTRHRKAWYTQPRPWHCLKATSLIYHINNNSSSSSNNSSNNNSLLVSPSAIITVQTFSICKITQILNNLIQQTSKAPRSSVTRQINRFYEFKLQYSNGQRVDGSTVALWRVKSNQKVAFQVTPKSYYATCWLHILRNEFFLTRLNKIAIQGTSDGSRQGSY